MLFKKGRIPWNKGTKGIMKPNKTSFKKGQIPKNKGKCSKTEKVCPICNKKFKSYDSGQKTFCSISCASKHSHTGMKLSEEIKRKISENNWSRKEPERAIKNLGKYAKKGNNLTWNKGLTKKTDDRIAQPWLNKKRDYETKKKISKTKTGDELFCGFKSSESKRIRGSKEYGKWRAAVFKRDNYTCQECGKCKCYLEAHHIRPFALFPELRFDINNGISYCIECHIKKDTYRGKRS